MRSRVEVFEQIRMDHHLHGYGIRELARRHGVHRRAVRQALASAVPPPRRAPERRPAPALGEYRALIDAWLIADRTAPVKQRHTARRIWQRLADEHGAEVSERQVRRYVRSRRLALGHLVDEVFVPLATEPGAEAEVDWAEADIVIAGVQTRVYLFVMRACHSGAAYVEAHTRQTQQAFLESHVEAFRFFGGVFGLIRYDNLSAAVARVLKGRRRIESDRFVALRSHYLFEASFTRRGRAGAHEKGGVEGEVGRFRRNHLVPVPRVESLDALNDYLRSSVIDDLNRVITGRHERVGDALAAERLVLAPIPPEPFDTAEHASPRVDAKALVTIRQNQYSVPVRLAGLRVAACIGAREIVIVHDGREVARHARLLGRYQTRLELDHYLELLAVKPGALARSLALAQERQRGAWPDVFDELWAALRAKHGESDAARQMVDVLMAVRASGPRVVELAVRGALAAGAIDGRAVELLARRADRPVPARLAGLAPRLSRHDRPEPDLGAYDRLIGGAR
jgi:transposase